MIPLLVTSSSVLVFALHHIKTLRELGIVGVLSGSLPKAPQQNVFLGVPLQLSPYEALWLVQAGHAFFVDSESYHGALGDKQREGTWEADISDKTQYVITPDTVPIASESELSAYVLSVDKFVSLHSHKSRFWEKYGAFCYLRNKDYYLMPGLRFGGAFVAYPGDPLNFHSHLIVKALHADEPLKLMDIVTGGRLATAVKKAWIVIDADPKKHSDSKPTKQHVPKAFTIEWAGFG